MSDDDYVIESSDAGASSVIPMEAGQIKKGGCVAFDNDFAGGLNDPLILVHVRHQIL